jgi:sugar/nucleoside kinase (ribokinase family)
MSKRVWIVGPIAWDTVLYLHQYPSAGGFAQGYKKIERPGGSAGNVALGLSTTGVETGFVCYLGNDDIGIKLDDLLNSSQIKNLEITRINGPSSHVLVVIDESGDRTIFGLNESYLSQVNLDNVQLHADDIVCFVLWRPYFLNSLKKAKEAGCTTIVGVEALGDPMVTHADVVIGSRAEFKSDNDLVPFLDRFPTIIVTNGEHGATRITKEGIDFQPALPAQTIDTTGAGDSFLAGYLAAYAHGHTEGKHAMEVGARWAALMVTLPVSIPPDFSELPGFKSLL